MPADVPLLVITGPTASGKTAVAIELAKQLQGEIISADSMQVYKHLSIGTAKPTSEELQGVPYHLIDHQSPNQQYHLGRFVSEATALIEEMQGRGVQPIICGGTGLYIRGLLYGIFEGGEVPPEVRQQVEEKFQREGLQGVFEELRQIDPVSAGRYGANDRQRILRAVEVYRATGIPMSSFHQQDAAKPQYRARVFVLSPPREVLYERINTRVDNMADRGLIDEVRAYLAAGYSQDNPAIKALGYREIIQALQQNADMKAAMETMKQKSRNYAKRQLTWFRAIPAAQWIDTDDKLPADIAGEIASDWKRFQSNISTC